MKNYILIIFAICFTLSCKAQTIVNLDGPLGGNHYQKDLNNVRANFVGTWQYVSGTTEFTIHIYKKDMVSQGSWWNQGEYWRDIIVGNYIYKENGLEIINTSQYMPSLNSQYGPFYAHTRDGISTEELLSTITDFGKPYLNSDCELRYKRGEAQMDIINLGSGSPLQAIFKVLPIAHTIRTINPACNDTNDYTGFSIPTEMVLTKISDTPPPLN
jgi:hypothetical protein